MDKFNQLPEGLKRKLEKLIKLRDGAMQIGSLEEANSAASKIQGLLMEYNLEESELTFEEKTTISHELFDIEGVGWSKNEAGWTKTLFHVLCKHNLCMAVFSHPMGDKNKPPKVTFMGNTLNRQIVLYLFDQLVVNLRSMESKRWRGYENGGGHEKRGTFRRGYFLGAVQGITIQLRDQANEIITNTPKGGELIRVTGVELQAYSQNLFPSLRSSTQRGTKSQSGKTLGLADGRSMQMKRGISGSGNQGRLLS